MKKYIKTVLWMTLCGAACLQGYAQKQSNNSLVNDFGVDWKFHAGEGRDSSWSTIGYQDNHPTYGHSAGNAFHTAGLNLFRRVLHVEQPR